MDKDKIREELVKELKRIMPCTCLDAYKKRGLCAPDCSWCGYGEEIVDFILARDKADEIRNALPELLEVVK